MHKKTTFVLFIALLASASIFTHDVYATDFQKIRKLLASDAKFGDSFGYSVSISGDFAIVGAYGKNTGGSRAGAAYVFYKDQGGADNWGLVTMLTAGDAEAGDFFGYSVSISSDFAIVGAWGEGADGSINAGAAYIFNKDQGGADNWGQVSKLTAGDAEAGDRFGYNVSISGDYAIVGAYQEGTGGPALGAAYIFNKDQGGLDNWGEVTKLTASDAQADDQFGFRVSISGDYAIVGAYAEDAGGAEAGAAYIFNKDQGGADNWWQVTKLTADDAEAGDIFGYSVSISGGFAIVGAIGEDTGGSEAGAAYIFNKDQGGIDNWGEVKKLMASDAEAGDRFGSSVSISGDYAIVGAYAEDEGGLGAGAAYMFNKDQGGGAINWREVEKLTASDPRTDVDDWFGFSVSISGDYAIVGAFNYWSTRGVAYMFKLITTGIEETPERTDIVIYPEIADDIITIEYYGIYNNLQASIYSIDGRKLIEQLLNGELNIINISNLTPGTYFIQVDTPDGPVVRKFIKR